MTARWDGDDEQLLPGLIVEPPAIVRHAEWAAIAVLTLVVLGLAAWLTLHPAPAAVPLQPPASATPSAPPAPVVTVTVTPDPVPATITVRWTR